MGSIDDCSLAASAPSEKQKAILEAADKKLVVEAAKHQLSAEEEQVGYLLNII